MCDDNLVSGDVTGYQSTELLRYDTLMSARRRLMSQCGREEKKEPTFYITAGKLLLLV